MEVDSNAPTNGGPDSASAPAAAKPSQPSEELKSSSVPSMSGALQGGDVKDSSKITDEAESM